VRAPRRAIWLTLTLLTAITLAACAKPFPTAPAPPAQTLQVTGLTISGVPASFSYGQSVQLMAIATLSNGTQKETLEVAAVWQSSDKSVATVSDTGLLVVTGFRGGDADVTATFQNQQASVRVALPPPMSLVHEVAWLCDPRSLVLCTPEGILESVRRVNFRAPTVGTIRVESLRRSFDYEEYLRPQLRCGDVPRPLSRVPEESGELLPSPSWFADHLHNHPWPAGRDVYVTPADNVCEYELELTVDLRSPPFSPVEVNVFLVR
jgi:Big-like domain-containing protein